MAGFQGRVAVVTGGASGIGEASVRRFVAAGARVVCADVRDDRGRRLAAELGPACTYRHADVSVERDVAALVADALARHGRIDCLFSNAGVAGPDDPIAATAADTWDAMVGVLLRGAYLGMRFAAPSMIARRSGCILSTAGVAGLRAGLGSHACAAAQAGVIQLTRSVALELAGHGVRVNCLCPGGIASPLLASALGQAPEEADLGPSRLRPLLARMQPLARAGEAEDVAEAALWLASDAASFVTGQALVVDGGLSAGLAWPDARARAASLVRALSPAGTPVGMPPGIRRPPRHGRPARR
jgi:NAD(P)-dependent dehydrogenase (short-subunit alcohol dehydrogenase family)